MLRAVRAMKREGFDFVLYLQEDMWVIEPVDADEMAELVEVMDAFRIDALKLAVQWDPPPEVDDLGRHCGPVGEGAASKFRWVGSHPYVFSHHTTVFRVDFLLEALYVSKLFRRVRPIQQEQFCSAYLKNRTVARSGDGGRYRMADVCRRTRNPICARLDDGPVDRGGVQVAPRSWAREPLRRVPRGRVFSGPAFGHVSRRTP